MAVKLKKVALKLLTKQASYVERWSRGHASHVRQGTQSMLKCEYVSLQDRLAREHISTQDTLTRHHLSSQNTLAREHEST